MIGALRQQFTSYLWSTWATKASAIARSNVIETIFAAHLSWAKMKRRAHNYHILFSLILFSSMSPSVRATYGDASSLPSRGSVESNCRQTDFPGLDPVQCAHSSHHQHLPLSSRRTHCQCVYVALASNRKFICGKSFEFSSSCFAFSFYTSNTKYSSTKQPKKYF